MVKGRKLKKLEKSMDRATRYEDWREAAIEHEMHATFLAKPMAEEAGSALHIHQSVVDKDGNNIFSDSKGEPTELFHGFLDAAAEKVRFGQRFRSADLVARNTG